MKIQEKIKKKIKEERKIIFLCRWLLFFCFFVRFLFFLFLFCPQYIDVDQTLMWYGTVCFAHGFFPEPHFFGQNYGMMLESLGSVPLYWAGIPLAFAMPAMTMLMTFAPFLYLSEKCKKENPVLSVVLLLIPFLGSFGVDLLNSVPRALSAGYLFSVIGAVLIAESKSKNKIFLGAVSMWIGITALLPSVLFYAAALPYAWKKGIFQKEKLKYFIMGNLLGMGFFGYAALFYVIFPEYVVHVQNFLPVSYSCFRDNVIHFPDFCRAVFLFPDFYWILIFIFVCFSLLVVLKWYQTIFMLAVVFFIVIPCTFFTSWCCHYVHGSLLFGVHRFFLFLFPLTALILYLSGKHTRMLPCRYFSLSTVIMVAAACFLTGWKISAFPVANHDMIAARWSVSLNELNRNIQMIEEEYLRRKPDALIMRPTAVAYASAAYFYGRTHILLPYSDRKPWDQTAFQNEKEMRKFLVCYFFDDNTTCIFKEITVKKGNSIQGVFDESFQEGSVPKKDR